MTDAETRILWTYGGRVMRRKAETVNFVAGGRWDDTSVGTNALDLATRNDAPVDGVQRRALRRRSCTTGSAGRRRCTTRVSGEQLGVIDLSTTWDRTHPIGLATARVMARLIETAMPASEQHPSLPGQARRQPSTPGLDLTLLGAAEAHLDGRRLLLNRRQTEILALLALNPAGLSLEQLHALLYGDQAVTFSTLKAEVSHLRSALEGQLASRPYRLTMPVPIDVNEVLRLLRSGQVRAAVAAYGGDLMPGTESPALVELADYVAVAVREALLADPQPQAVARYTELAPYDTEVIEVCLAVMGESPHPAKALLKGRLAAAAADTRGAAGDKMPRMSLDLNSRRGRPDRGRGRHRVGEPQRAGARRRHRGGPAPRSTHLEVTRIGNSLVARTDLGRDERVVIAGHIDTVPLNRNLPVAQRRHPAARPRHLRHEGRGRRRAAAGPRRRRAQPRRDLRLLRVRGDRRRPQRPRHRSRPSGPTWSRPTSRS